MNIRNIILVCSLNGLPLLLSGCNSSTPESSTGNTSSATSDRVAVTSPTPIPATPTATAPVVDMPTPQPTTSAINSQPLARSSRQTSVEATDNIPQLVADLSTHIRNAPSEEEANAHVFACRSMVEKLNDKMRSDPANVDVYAQWGTAMSHLANAADYKSASFKAWGDVDARSKLMNMEAELNAAQGNAVTTQRLIEERRNPALAAQRQNDFRRRVDGFEAQQRPADGPVMNGGR